MREQWPLWSQQTQTSAVATTKDGGHVGQAGNLESADAADDGRRRPLYAAIRAAHVHRAHAARGISSHTRDRALVLLGKSRGVQSHSAQFHPQALA